MDKTKLMLKYAGGESLNNEELDFLEDCFIVLIYETRLSDRRPSIANDQICDYLGLRRKSFELNCMASILDKVRPIENDLCREQQVFHVILQSRFLYY
tara:strand:+ start:225 stop:518 length:294 start_codon:yes stop_codon:yes gene_type:complete